MSELTEKLKETHGSDRGYYTVLKQILAECGQQIADDANAMKAVQGGKFTLYNIGQLALTYDLNFKATCEWLEESRILAVGTYDRLKRSGVKATEILEAVKAEQ